jgi:hypothetical protein
MEREGSLPCSQKPSTGPYPKSCKSSPYFPHLAPTSKTSYWSSSFWLSHQCPTSIPFLPICAICKAHLFFLGLIVIIMFGEEYKLCSSSLCSVLHPPVTSLLFGPNILLSNRFTKTLSLCSCLNVRDKVSHSNKTTGKLVVWKPT